MKLLAVDVDYRDQRGFVAGIEFTVIGGVAGQYLSIVEGVSDYISGQFYKRELPGIHAVIREHQLEPDCVVIDGYVYLENNKPGLGKYLFDSLNARVKVIGVAKSPRPETYPYAKCLEGRAKNHCMSQLRD